jgi:hypothetical protein
MSQLGFMAITSERVKGVSFAIGATEVEGSGSAMAYIPPQRQMPLNGRFWRSQMVSIGFHGPCQFSFNISLHDSMDSRFLRMRACFETHTCTVVSTVRERYLILVLGIHTGIP